MCGTHKTSCADLSFTVHGRFHPASHFKTLRENSIHKSIKLKAQVKTELSAFLAAKLTSILQ